MFMGEYNHTIDAKGRLIIPAKIREQLGDHCVLSKGLDNCIAIYTAESWEQLSKTLQSLPSNKANARAIKRFYFGSAAELEFDKQGRIWCQAPFVSMLSYKRMRLLLVLVIRLKFGAANALMHMMRKWLTV